jgi:peptide/nickel transport system permease protein
MSSIAATPARLRQQHPLVAFVLRRIAVGVLLVFLVSILVFGATQVLPGDAASAILGRSATAEQKELYRQELGLDRSIPAQYWTWISGVASGDLGKSLASREPVTSFISERIGDSLILAFVTMIILVPIALALGVWAGVQRNKPADHVISGVSLGLIALPEFVIGTLLIAFIAVYLGLLPPTSIIGSGESPLTSPELLVLPVLTLCCVAAAYIIRMVRAGIVDTMSSDYIQMARLNGVPERRVVIRHGLRNALAPTVQVLALTLQYLIGGLVIVETVFAYPGLGQGLVQAVVARDIPVVQGIAILLATIYIVINIVADVAVVLLNPKLRTSQ